MQETIHLEGLARFRAELELQQAHSPSNTTKMLISTLNQLEKSGLITQEQFELAMSDRHQLVAAFESYLRQKGNKDLRTPRARLNALIDEYQVRHASVENLTFADALRQAVHAHYGELTKGGGKYPRGITLAHVARDIFAHLLEQGIEREKGGYQTKIWERNFSNWYHGKHEPARIKNAQHIKAIEVFFGLPAESLLSKLAEDEVDYSKRFKTPRYKRSRRFIKGPLPYRIAAHLDQFARFKLAGEQPRILQYPLDRVDPEQRRFFYITNPSNRNGGAWTEDGAGRCKSKEAMEATWRSFISYLHFDHEWADEPPSIEDCDLSIFSDDEVLEGFVELIVEKGIGYQTASRFLHFVESNAHVGGYYRHCVQPPEGMSVEDWFRHLDNLLLFIPRLQQRLRQASRSISNPALRHYEDAKRNIRFLLQMDTDSTHEYLDRLVAEAFRVARSNKRRSSRRRAMTFAWVGMLLKLMLVVPLRAANWAAMRYFEEQDRDDLKTPSITYIRTADRYRIWVPKSFLKNRDGKTTKSIEVMLPSSHNPFIQRYLQYRLKYLQHIYSGDPADIPFFGISRWKADDPPEQMTPGNVCGRFSHVTFALIKRLEPNRDQIGINIHAMRHLAATLFLRENPREYPVVATMLNDSLQVVISTYAELDAYHNNERIIDWITDREARVKSSRRRRPSHSTAH